MSSGRKFWAVAAVLGLCAGCGSDKGTRAPAPPVSDGGGGASDSNAGSTSSGSGANAGGSQSSGGDYVVPDRERCSDGGEVLAVDFRTGQIAADETSVYFLASSDPLSDASLDLLRLPQALGPVEAISTQSLYGFGLGVRSGLVSWLARPHGIVSLDEDYVGWNLWTWQKPGQAPRLELENGVLALAVGVPGIVVARIFITAITADASHVYWLEHLNGWSCLKRIGTN